MQDLTGVRVAIIANDGFEQAELTEPLRALRKANASVFVVAPHLGHIQGFRHLEKGETVNVDRKLSDVGADDFDALVLPGGTSNADSLRMDADLKTLLRDFQADRKPIAAICHAPWELVSAGLVNGRTLTSYHSIQDDIRNAGGNWLDRDVVEDDNWITSRQPSDLPAFCRQMTALFAPSQPSSRNEPRAHAGPKPETRGAPS